MNLYTAVSLWKFLKSKFSTETEPGLSVLDVPVVPESPAVLKLRLIASTLKGNKMSTPVTTSTTPSDLLKQLGEILEADAFKVFNPVISATLTDMQTNAAQWTNPATAAIKGAAAVAQLAAAVPNLESGGVAGAASLLALFWNAVGAKVTAQAAAAQTALTGLVSQIPAGGA